MENERKITVTTKRLGVLIGGSGLIGGTLLHYFKTRTNDGIEILTPNSKRLSLREPEDIQQYFRKFKPDFIINTAITAIDSDPQIAFEVNYLGSINLAKVAAEMNIPYIHFSSAAIMPMGKNLSEDDVLPLSPKMSNYAKSKLMAELTLKHLREKQGLDYSVVRLAVVYGKHDHKIQGFHRLLFSIIDQAMPLMLTRRGVKHSFSNARKLPLFVHHMLNNRDKYSGQTYNFVDRQPVELSQLILTIKSYMKLSMPKEIYLPYLLAVAVKSFIAQIIKGLIKIGIETRMPGELMFLDKFYKSQTLSSEKLDKSGFVDPAPESTIYSELPDLIQYYLTRWEQLNLITRYNKEFFDPKRWGEEFLHSPAALIESIHNGMVDPFAKSADPRKQADSRPGPSRAVVRPPTAILTSNRQRLPSTADHSDDLKG